MGSWLESQVSISAVIQHEKVPLLGSIVGVVGNTVGTPSSGMKTSRHADETVSWQVASPHSSSHSGQRKSPRTARAPQARLHQSALQAEQRRLPDRTAPGWPNLQWLRLRSTAPRQWSIGPDHERHKTIAVSSNSRTAGGQRTALAVAGLPASGRGTACVMELSGTLGR